MLVKRWATGDGRYSDPPPPPNGGATFRELELCLASDTARLIFVNHRVKRKGLGLCQIIARKGH